MVVLVPPEVLLAPPSSQDGIDAATEGRLRAFGAEQIQRAGVLLKLPQVTVASAAAIFQRFYFHRSFAEFEARAGVDGVAGIGRRIGRSWLRNSTELPLFRFWHGKLWRLM